MACRCTGVGRGTDAFDGETERGATGAGGERGNVRDFGEFGGDDDIRGEFGGVGFVGTSGERGGVLETDGGNGERGVRGEGGGASGMPERTSEGRGISGRGCKEKKNRG